MCVCLYVPRNRSLFGSDLVLRNFWQVDMIIHQVLWHISPYNSPPYPPLLPNQPLYCFKARYYWSHDFVSRNKKHIWNISPKREKTEQRVYSLFCGRRRKPNFGLLKNLWRKGEWTSSIFYIVMFFKLLYCVSWLWFLVFSFWFLMFASSFFLTYIFAPCLQQILLGVCILNAISEKIY